MPARRHETLQNPSGNKWEFKLTSADEYVVEEGGSELLGLSNAGLLDVPSLALAGVTITASAAEINKIDGFTGDFSDLNYLADVTPGTVVASKAVLVGADKNVDTLAIADGGLKLGAGAGTAVTATAAELNLIDGSVAGTAVASKAAVLGANKELDTLVVADGGLKLGAGAGTAITATAAELNLIDGSVAGTAVASKALVLGADKNVDVLAIADGGLALGAGAGTAVTSTAAELNLLDGSVAGTAVASKALVVGANKEVDTLVIADGGLKLGAGAGTAVTATAAELNLIDGSVAGTSVASKALVLGADKNVDVLAIADGGLALGAGAGTAVTATAAELNLIDGAVAGTAVASKALVLGSDKNVDTIAVADGGLKLGAGAGTAVTTTAAEINKFDGAPLEASFVIGAEDGGGKINVAIQLQDGNGADLAVRGSVRAYLSDDANGDSTVATAPSGAVAIGTDGVLYDVGGAKKHFLLTSESDGDIDIDITEAGAKTEYLIIVLPNGKLVASGAITHAA